MLNPPTFGLPVTVPEGGLLRRGRWSLYPDRLTRESQEFLWGYSPDSNVMLGDVRLIYVYHRARPLNLLWGLFGIPFLLVAVAIASDSRDANSIGVAIFASIGLGIILLACVLGFLRRPHVTIQTSRETVSIGMDRPWWSGSRRRVFFNGLAQILGVPDLLPGGGVRRPTVPRPGVIPGSVPAAPQPPQAPMPHAATDAEVNFWERPAPPPPPVPPAADGTTGAV
ncbi:MAG: hypothetical protein AAB074_07210 [Planctomycetota bacterium]